MVEDTRLRLFAAIELPESWRQALVRIRADLERVAWGELRWVRPDLMHLTLVFLGYQPAETLPSIREAMGTAGSEANPFQLSLDRVGCFGQPGRVQVLWVGLAETPPELQKLHQSLAAQLSAREISFDRKPLVPHITLARVRRPMDRALSLRLYSAIQKTRALAGLSAEVQEFVLMQSHLSSAGPEYEVVARFRLGAKE